MDHRHPGDRRPRRGREVRRTGPRPPRRHRRERPRHPAPAAHRLGIPKSSLHALLRTMCARGWLDTDQTGSVYRLGIHTLTVSSAYLDGDPVLSRAAAVMDEVAAATEETVHLGRLAGATSSTPPSASPSTLCGCTRPSAGAYRRTPPRSGARSSPSSPRPSAPTLVPQRIIPLTAQTTTDRDALLRDHRRRGPARLRDGERGVLPGRALLRRRAALLAPDGRRAERRGADQPSRPGSGGLHHRDPAEREGPAVVACTTTAWSADASHWPTVPTSIC